MNRVVAIVGKGRLAEMTSASLSRDHEVICLPHVKDEAVRSAAFVLVLQDEWSPSAMAEAGSGLQPLGIPWLCGFVSSEEGIVGPLVRPGVPGCPQCADSRRLTADRDRDLSPMQMMGWLYGEERHADPSTSVWGLRQMACLIAAETCRVLRGQPARTEGHLYLVCLKTLETSLHLFQPDPLCEACGRLPADSSQAARISLKSCPKAEAGSFRYRTMTNLKEVLAPAYFDRRTGMFNRKLIASASIFADVNVNMPFSMGDEVTTGRSHTYSSSELIAIMEGLERYSGLFPRGKQTMIHDTYRKLADLYPGCVLDPFRIGLYTKEQYAQPEFPFVSYDHDRMIDWVWGYSFLHERPILVPELIAYYSMGFEQSFVSEGSNGCALGGNLEEAILHGILEVVERDAFLMTWYARIPIPRLDPFSSDDVELRWMIERLRAVSGYELHLYNASMENRIPSVWAVAVNGKPEGARLVSAAGAHVDPIRAVKSAVHELAGMIPMLNEMYAEHGEEVRRMYNDSSLVRTMADHAMVYCLPQAEERLKFLLDGDRPMRTFGEEFPKWVCHDDLKDDLEDLLCRFRELGMEVVAIEQTPPEISRYGLHCVKVLIPGMLPMTFGHHLTRLTGLERVWRVPNELGYAKQRLTRDQLNPHPHPFP